MSDEEQRRQIDHSLGLHVVRQGRGKPVVLLHGYGATHYTWRELAAVLAPRRELWRVDLKGHGQSACPRDGKYALNDHADLIYRLITENDLRDVTLIGNSLGGGIALLVAIRLVADGAQRLASLVLIDGIAFPQKIPLFIRVASCPLIGPIALFGLPARLIVRYVLISAFFDPAKIDRSAIDAYAVNLQSAGHRRALIETAKALIPSDFNATQQHYATIDVPTLLIWGQQDRIVPPMVGVGLNAVLPRSDLFFIDRCGHMPQEERPDIVNKRVAEFLGD